METHTISVILPAYNAENYLSEAIKSILKQTFYNYELIIIDDGSSDRTSEIIHSYQDSRIKYFKNLKNLGIVRTLNIGFANAKGKYIARMDADDISYPERLEIQYKYMEDNPNIGVVGTDIELFGNNIHECRHFSNSPKMLKAELLFNSCLPHPTAMIRRSVLIDHNLLYNENFNGCEDFALWWEICKYSDIGMINQILHKYRLHEKQVTAKHDDKQLVILGNFLEYRMSDIGYSLIGKEKDVFLKYCIGQYKQMTKEEVNIFIECLSNIKKTNIEKRFLPCNELSKVCSLGVFECIKYMTNKERRECFQFAIRHNALSINMVIKYIAHKFINKR